MKRILLLLLTISLVSCIFPEEHSYSGTVVDKFRTDAGYKSSPEAHVVFYCDSLHRNIDVKVTWNCYANTSIGERITFTLMERQLNY